MTRRVVHARDGARHLPRSARSEDVVVVQHRPEVSVRWGTIEPAPKCFSPGFGALRREEKEKTEEGVSRKVSSRVFSARARVSSRFRSGHAGSRALSKMTNSVPTKLDRSFSKKFPLCLAMSSSSSEMT